MLVSDARSFLNIALVGFMGTGKSSVGRLAAEQLRFEFIDTDDWIENEIGLTVPQIFAQQGEAAFRQHEKEALLALGARKDTVIATGGGVAADPSNMASLKSHALVFGLWASAETILQRVGAQSDRPLLQTPDPLARIRELLEQRGPAYRQADVQILTEFRSSKEVAQQVVQHFLRSRKGK